MLRCCFNKLLAVCIFYYCFSLFFESNQIYFGYILSSPSTPPRSSSTFLPIQLHVLSLKKQKQNPQKCGVHFVLANYSWWWGLSWSVVNIPSVTPLEEKQTNPIFQQLSIEKSFLVRGGTLCHYFPTPVLAWACVGLHILSESLGIHLCPCPVVCGKQFPWSPPLSPALTVFPPLRWRG